MIPSDTRLINGIRLALGAFASSDRSEEDRRRVAAIEVALAELLRRQDESFQRAFFEQGRLLIDQAAELGVVLPATGHGDVLDQLTRVLESVVCDLAPRDHESAVHELLARIVDWENALYQRRIQSMPPIEPDDADEARYSAERIAHYLRGRWPEWGVLRVANVHRLSGGFSKSTVLFDVDSQTEGHQSLVIRAEQKVPLLFFDGAQARYEFHLLRCVRRAGVPVAEPLWFDDSDSAFGVPLMVSRRAPGRNFGSRIDVRETISDALLRDLVAQLVRIHAVSIDRNDPDVAACHLGHWARHGTLSECVAAEIAFLQEKVAEFEMPASPMLCRALEWMARHVPRNDEPPSLLHGDYGLHNILIGDDDQVSCILDWEIATLGDPAEDLVWLCEGLKASHERARIVSLYHELGGKPVSEARLRYFDVMNCARFLIAPQRALQLFEQLPGASVDALQLGLLYTWHGAHGLNHCIEEAEAAMKV